jgi:DNA gyrase subunit B/topoisomerase-4 subunit B
MAGSYTGKDITVLEGLDPVRKRPAMYIGGTGKAGYHHLLWEILDNSIDEVINKHATRIDIVLNKDGKTISVEDNGRGIPVDTIKKFKKSALEVILSTLHAGGKFEGKNYAHSGGLHGVGASVVNALSSHMLAEVKRGGSHHTLELSRGKTKGKLKKKKGARGTGTKLSFTPDAEIFGKKLSFDTTLIRNRLEAKSYLHRNVKINFRDETVKPAKTDTFHHEGGISEFLTKIIKDRGKSVVPADCKAFYLSKMDDATSDIPFELAMLWTESTDEHIKSYVNGVPTPNGGTHENGLRSGVVKAVRNYMSTHSLTPKGVTLSADDIREGITVILSAYVAEPQFQGQTKERLNNPPVTAVIDGAVRPALEQWLNENKSIADAVIARIVLAARAREASRAASAAVTRKSAVSHRLNLPGKLADCSSTNPAASELFLVEGDSAGGSAKQGRNRKTQAILPLRGKVLNAEQATITKLMANKELGNIVSALGCGIGPKMDLSKLRYDKIFLLMDADADGLHIATLLLTFFYRYMKPLIDNKHIFLAQPPLYRIDIGKQTFYALDDLERDAILEEHQTGNRKASITRFKGLGEMSPTILNETTLDPKTRTTLRVTIHDGDEMATDLCISELLGKDASARYRLITENSGEIDELDV